MKRSDHHMLGCFLLDQYGINLEPATERLFLFGCVEPDMNPFTYTRGSLQYQFLHGHNRKNVKKHLNKIIEKLNESGVQSPTEWFTCGTALHYMADSFTFPHNENFEGTVREHRAYERRLHPVLEDYMGKQNKKSIFIGRQIDDIDLYHEEYMADFPSYMTDSKYIIGAVSDLFRSLLLNSDRSELRLAV